jgi:hypothetical protein
MPSLRDTSPVLTSLDGTLVLVEGAIFVEDIQGCKETKFYDRLGAGLGQGSQWEYIPTTDFHHTFGFSPVYISP